MGNKITGVVSFDADEVSEEILRELAAIERLQSEMNEIQRRVLAYRQLLAAHGFNSFPENDRAVADIEAKSREVARRIADALRSRDAESLTAADNMVLVLAEHGAPMTARQIYEGLVQRGIQIAGVNPIASVLTMLRRDKRVMRRHSPTGFVHHIRPFDSVPDQGGEP